jgi:hypothetical protein
MAWQTEPRWPTPRPVLEVLVDAAASAACALLDLVAPPPPSNPQRVARLERELGMELVVDGPPRALRSGTDAPGGLNPLTGRPFSQASAAPASATLDVARYGCSAEEAAQVLQSLGRATQRTYRPAPARLGNVERR